MAFRRTNDTGESAVERATAEIPRRVHGPCLLNVVPGGRTPLVNAATAAAMGYRLAIHPALLLYPMVAAAESALAALRASGAPSPPPPGFDIAGLFRRCGAPEWDALRERYAHTAGDEPA